MRSKSPLLRREGNTKHKKIDVRRHETHALHRFMDYNLKGKQILKGKEKRITFSQFPLSTAAVNHQTTHLLVLSFQFLWDTYRRVYIWKKKDTKAFRACILMSSLDAQRQCFSSFYQDFASARGFGQSASGVQAEECHESSRRLILVLLHPCVCAAQILKLL